MKLTVIEADLDKALVESEEYAGNTCYCLIAQTCTRETKKQTDLIGCWFARCGNLRLSWSGNREVRELITMFDNRRSQPNSMERLRRLLPVTFEAVVS